MIQALSSRPVFSRFTCFSLMLLLPLASFARAQPDHPDAARIAMTCESCHGNHGQGYGDIPSIAGMSEQTFLKKLLDFRSNRAPSTVMGRIVNSYSENDLALLARHFAKK